MMRLLYTIALPLSLILYWATLPVFAQDMKFDGYCGKKFSSAQNDCQHRCVSGTDKECVDILGEEYRCVSASECSMKMQRRELDGVAGQGVCASNLKNGIMGCGYEMTCEGDLDCAVGELCYSDVGCGSVLMETHSEILFTMIRVEKPMGEGATRTFKKALLLVIEPILEASNTALDSVTVLDSQHTGTVLYVTVKISGLYRPSVEQNLGEIIINAFNTGAQTAFRAALGNNFFGGVIGVFLSLKSNESIPAPPPTPPPTVSIKIETLPPNIIVPSTPVQSPQIPTTAIPDSGTNSPVSNQSPGEQNYSNQQIIGDLYLAVLIQNSPYQTYYMNDEDFDVFAEVFMSTIAKQMKDSLTYVTDYTLGYHQLISLGNGVTATEINFGYTVSTNLTSTDVGRKVARAVGRARTEIISSLRENGDIYPYYLEIKEIQAQNIVSVGEPTSTATLPKNIPEKPITQSPTPFPSLSPTPPKIEEEEEHEVIEEDVILVGDLLESDAAKAQAAKDAAMAKTNATTTSFSNETNVVELVNAIEAGTMDEDEPASSIVLYAGIAGGVLFCFILAGLSYLYIRKKRINGGKKELDEEDVEGDLQRSNRSSPKRKTWSIRGSATTDGGGDNNNMSSTSNTLPDTVHDLSERDDSKVDIEVGEKLSAPDIPDVALDVPEREVPERRGTFSTDDQSSTTGSKSREIPTGVDNDDFQGEIVDGDVIEVSEGNTPASQNGGKEDNWKSKNSQINGDSSSSSSSSGSDSSSSSDEDSSSDESESKTPSKSLRSKGKKAVKARNRNKRINRLREENLAASAEALSSSRRDLLSRKKSERRIQGSGRTNRARSQNRPNRRKSRRNLNMGDIEADLNAAEALSDNKNDDRINRRKSRRHLNMDDIEADLNAAEALDENKNDEGKSNTDDDSLSEGEINQKLDELKAKYSKRKSQVEAHGSEFSSGKSERRRNEQNLNEKDRRKPSSSKSSRRLLDESKQLGNPSGKSRRNLGDDNEPSSGKSRRTSERRLSTAQSRRHLGGERNLASGQSQSQSRRRLDRQESERKFEEMRKSLTKSKSTRATNTSENRLKTSPPRSSKRRSTGVSTRDIKRSSEKSRRRINEDNREDKRDRSLSPSELDNTSKTSSKSKRRKDDEATSRSKGSERKRNIERRKSERKTDASGMNKSPKRELRRSKSRREPM